MAYLETSVRVFPIETPFTPVIQDVNDSRIEVSETLYPYPDRVHLRMILLLGTVLMLACLFVLIRPTVARPAAHAPGAAAAASSDDGVVGAQTDATAILSTVFTPEIQYWGPQIATWAVQHDLDPNVVATIMQIESCGDPLAVSSAGAQGLFQVMPFHFQLGEDMLDPDTNAARGLAYFTDRLTQTGGDVGRAFAGYNGGHVAAGSGWDYWAAETQRYFLWSTGIYGEVLAGASRSETLQRWMEAGGASLCRQAAGRLGL